MPYSSIDDLPESVKSLPTHAKEIFKSAFNSAYEKYKSEEKAFRIAWGAVKKSYHKSGDTWVKNKEEPKPEPDQEQKLAMFMNVEFLNANHQAILQTLNRDIGGYYFPSETFANNATAWDGIPIVYATDHPDMNLFAKNPTLALDKIKGRIVGQVSMPYIETVGHPRLMANMEITDEEINRFITEGKISHSTGFIGSVDGKTVKSVTPNHVLVFLEDDKNVPKDRGAFILNKQEDTITDTYNHDDDKLSLQQKETNRMTEESKDKENELVKQLEISNKEKETLTVELNGLRKQIAEKDEQLKVFAQKEAEALKATRESQWQKIKGTIPVGLTHKVEDEQKLRAEFEADPYGFAVKLTEFKNMKGTELGEEGIEFQNQAGPDAKETDQALQELRELGGMTRRRRV